MAKTAALDAEAERGRAREAVPVAVRPIGEPVLTARRVTASGIALAVEAPKGASTVRVLEMIELARVRSIAAFAADSGLQELRLEFDGGEVTIVAGFDVGKV